METYIYLYNAEDLFLLIYLLRDEGALPRKIAFLCSLMVQVAPCIHQHRFEYRLEHIYKKNW